VFGCLIPFFLVTGIDPAAPSLDSQGQLYQQMFEQAQKENENLRSQLEKLRKQRDMSCVALDQKSSTLSGVRNAKAEDVFRAALKEVQDEHWDEAIISMEDFVRQYPKSALADHALFWIAQIYIQQNEVRLAKAELERLIELYPNGDRVKRAQAILQSLRGGGIHEPQQHQEGAH